MFKALCYQAGGSTYTLQITDVFYIPLTPWCGPLQSCVQGSNHVFKALCYQAGGTVLSADNRCILHTSNTLVGPLQSCVQGTVLSGRRHFYTLQITDVFYIPLTPWCGPLQSCVQGTVLSDRRHYLHTADNRCILHTSNTLVRTAPIMCSRHCVIRQEALLTHCR